MKKTHKNATLRRTEMVDLPDGYDDLRDRARLVPLLTSTLGEGNWQVERIDTLEGGAQQAFVVDGKPVYRPGGRIAKLAEGKRESEADVLDSVLQQKGMMLVEFRGETGTAVVARPTPLARQIRDRIAPHLGAKYPHHVETAIECGPTPDGDEGYLTAVHVRKAPVQSDRSKRRQTLLQAVSNVAPHVPDTIWRYQESIETGEQVARRTVDPLRDIITIDDFNRLFPNPETNPALSWKRFPVAVREDGSPVMFSFFHTLIVGQTGAGKGSVLWSILGNLLPAAREGLVKMYAIDPKGAEAIGDDGRPLGMFEQVAVNADEWSVMTDYLVRLMEERKGKGRSQAVTRENPLVVLVIDEMSALSKLDNDGSRKAQVASDLLTILSQGRSMNFLVVAAVQAPQKAMVGDQRDFMPMRVALRTGTASETDLVLGEGALDRGAESHLIPVAGPGNQYRTAGTGYMQLEGEPDPVRIRFPYTDDAKLKEWSEEFYRLRGINPRAVPIDDAFDGVTDMGEMELDMGDLEMEMELDEDEATPTVATVPAPAPPVKVSSGNPLAKKTAQSAAVAKDDFTGLPAPKQQPGPVNVGDEGDNPFGGQSPEKPAIRGGDEDDPFA